MKAKNQVHNRVTNFSLYEEERDPNESRRTSNKEYDHGEEDKNSIFDNNLILQKNIDSGYGRYYNLSTRRRMFMVLGITLGTIVFFFNLQTEINSYIINQYLTVERNLLQNQQPFPLEKRGGAFITTHSGCRIAKWIYDAVDTQTSSECNRSDIRQLTHKNIPLVKDYDTIYVPFNKQDEFVDMVLDYLDVRVILISGQWQNSHQRASDDAIQRILSSDNVVHWFCQNLKKYAGDNPHHKKISPFPYGLKEFGHQGPEQFSAYKRIFFEQSLNITASNKDTNILVGYISKAEPSRRHIPSGPKVSPEKFFEKMLTARYIFSPDGDRPDCYRHYEAIGLGVVPITQLDARLYRHLENGPAIFNNSDWNVESLEQTMDSRPTVNRNLVFEDYWMSWCDHVVGIALRWNTELVRDANIEYAQDLFTSYLIEDVVM